MKASQLIDTLQQLVAQHGDLEVGTLDVEYGVYRTIETVQSRESQTSVLGDDKELGSKFIGISI